MLISEPMETVKCAECGKTITRPVSAVHTICACTAIVPKTGSK